MKSEKSTAASVDAAASSKPVLLERDGDVAILTMSLVLPNLVGRELSTALISSLAEAVSDGCRAIVLRSSLWHFSAGADIGLFDNQGATFEENLNLLGVLREFDECPVPIIASVHGIAVARDRSRVSSRPHGYLA